MLLAVAAGIAVVIAALTKHSREMKKYKESTESFQNSTNALKDNASQLEANLDEMKGIYNQTADLTEEDRQRLKTLKEQNKELKIGQRILEEENEEKRKATVEAARKAMG